MVKHETKLITLPNYLSIYCLNLGQSLLDIANRPYPLFGGGASWS